MIWTSDRTRKDDFDDNLSKLIPTLICQETRNITRCYVQSQNCKDVYERLNKNFTFTDSLNGFEYNVPPQNLFR